MGPNERQHAELAAYRMDCVIARQQWQRKLTDLRARNTPDEHEIRRCEVEIEEYNREINKLNLKLDDLVPHVLKEQQRAKAAVTSRPD